MVKPVTREIPKIQYMQILQTAIWMFMSYLSWLMFTTEMPSMNMQLHRIVVLCFLMIIIDTIIAMYDHEYWKFGAYTAINNAVAGIVVLSTPIVIIWQIVRMTSAFYNDPVAWPLLVAAYVVFIGMFYCIYLTNKVASRVNKLLHDINAQLDMFNLGEHKEFKHVQYKAIGMMVFRFTYDKRQKAYVINA